jgi:quercetin dioxygenase-like cupin family protein
MTTLPQAVPHDLPEAALAIHRGDEALPWAQFGPDVETKVLHVKYGEGLWVVRSRMRPGCVLQTHRHTGPVHGFTMSGDWHYRESAAEVNRAGSYLFEPAGSVHTLEVLPDSDGPADVWFAIWGANLNLDTAGKVELVLDGPLMLASYLTACEEQGLGTPPVVVEA